MTTNTNQAAGDPRMGPHELDLRVADGQGLWAELVGHDRPAPLIDLDGEAIAPDGDDVCRRRDCTGSTARYLAGHRKYLRRESRVPVGLCAADLAAHRAGETFLVAIERRDGVRRSVDAATASRKAAAA